MQIRIGNRQDETSVRKLVAAAFEEQGLTADFEKRESDLRNIEGNYIWRDGTYLVVEENREVVAFAAACKSTDVVLELKRLFVAAAFRRKGLGRQLLEKVIKFARDLDYEEISVKPDNMPGWPVDFLERCGFKRAEGSFSYLLQHGQAG